MTAIIRSSPSGQPLEVLVPGDIPMGMGGEIFVPAVTNLADGTRQVAKLKSAENFNFDFVLPLLFNPAMFTAGLEGYALQAGAVGAGKTMNLSAEYGGPGQATNEHTEAAAQVITIPAVRVWFQLDLKPVLTNAQPGDAGGVNLAQDNVGGEVAYLGIRIAWA